MSNKRLGPFRLVPWFSERVWGRPDLRPWYESTGTTELVGEAWLTGPKCLVETGAMAGKAFSSVGKDEFPLLVKILFPNDMLSVQVHPDDAQAQAIGQARGKTECWYVLEAEVGAAVALGLRDGVTEVSVRRAVTDGTLEDLLNWVPVSVGEMIFVDAGTVHAIGPGVVLLETQQTCDVTYRLYDYGRPRELHLEQGLRVLKAKTAAGKVKPVQMSGFVRLIEQKYFVVDRYDVAAKREVVFSSDTEGCVVGLSGAALVESEGNESVRLLKGQAVVLPAGIGPVVVRSESGVSFVRSFVPVG